MAVKILESHSVSPSSGAGGENTLPLLYFDIIWLDFLLVDSLRFYPLKCSQSHFLDTILVNLKHSLSLTLNHFLPLSSKIIFPLSSSATPVSRYTAGDSLSLTIATSDDDFSHVVSNRPKPAHDFHQLVPQMPAAVYSSDEIKFSPLAIQLTLFPNQGICIAFTLHHSICDATTLSAFIHTWASINRSNGGDHLLNQLPFYGRDSVQDSTKLTIAEWNKMKANRPTVSLTLPLPSDRVRATFHLTDPQIEKLKALAIIKKPSTGRPSTFVVACAYLWSCLAKSEVDNDNNNNNDETEYLSFAVNCRGRLNPPLPENYFGNCLIQLFAASSRARLKGNEGFVAAAEAVADAVKSAAKSSRVSEFYENRLEIFSKLNGKRVVWVVGSSKLDPYGVDYGWGRAVKFECAHTDSHRAVHLCKARKGGIDIGFSMPKPNMHSFASVFNEYLFINCNL
ncbi:anthocyanidin 3-O-glucoside 6''-O-acyltransferase-like [Salvia hispanica]|uniref:anthocyanidin 3-O-glucoside 6''-O-acyltransferase-like n=1 Tax=Salvia hispanica TaxID=49212 RepID=UPI002008F732|nr:anthocyanidin 3-O-glucoside 6''-O-acyltransferase-like [Salvia hispanica]